MSYEVYGFVEVRFYPEEGWEPLEWRTLLDLGPFFLIGDEISERLFGLAKYPKAPGRFEKRGVPSDASASVQRWVAENDAFIAEHGEGLFGFTYALWSEITEVDLRDVDMAGDGWQLVFNFLPTLITPCLYKPDGIRIVVAGCW